MYQYIKMDLHFIDLVNIAFISVVSESSINNSDSDETIAATFFRQLFGRSEVIRIFTTLVVLSVMGTALSQQQQYGGKLFINVQQYIRIFFY
jgi:hypothetical protein